MSPITFEQAREATDPSLNDQQRDESARRIMEGVAANEVYWNHRPQLEALQAQADGHGVVSRVDDEESPTVVGAGTGSEPGTIEGTATEEAPGTALSAAAVDPAVSTTPDTSGPSPSPDNPNAAIAALRKQLRDAGINPEA